MRNKKILTCLLALFVTSFSFAQTGFLAKNKALGLDLNRLILDRTINAEMNFMINPNVNLIPSIGYIAFNTANVRRSLFDSDSAYFSQRGPTLGFRILATTYLTGQVAPLGHYYGYGYRFSRITQKEAATRIRDAINPIENKVNMHDINFFYGKSFLLSENMFLSFDLTIGGLLAFGYDPQSSDFGIKTLNSYLGAFSNAESFGEDKSVSGGWYVRPTLKLAYFLSI